jgi:phosphoglycerol transferase MdoB-like AlkP superfamily enzyme
MDNFFYDDNKKKVVMGNKKKDVDVKSLIMQNEEERKKRALHKLQMSSATLIQSELKRYLIHKQIANQIFSDGKRLVSSGGDVEMKEESKA